MEGLVEKVIGSSDANLVALQNVIASYRKKLRDAGGNGQPVDAGGSGQADRGGSKHSEPLVRK